MEYLEVLVVKKEQKVWFKRITTNKHTKYT